MKFRTKVVNTTKEITIDGRTETVPVSEEQKIPLVPRDWDTITTHAAFALVGVLTLVAIVWSTISIGQLLGGGVGFLAAVLFDISWAVCLILEWKARFDSSKRKFPRNLGWALLTVTMFFIGWHGVMLDSIPLAVVGAAVSLFAKVLWLAIMRFVDRELNPDHQAWVNAVISKSNAQLAVAEVLRQVALADDKAVALKLAIEANRMGIIGAEQVPDMSGQSPDTVPVAPANGSGVSGGLSNGNVLTGSGVLRTLSAEQIDEIKAAASTAALVRTLSGAGVRTLPEIMEVVRDLNLPHKESTIDRNLRGRGAKTS